MFGMYLLGVVIGGIFFGILGYLVGRIETPTGIEVDKDYSYSFYIDGKKKTIKIWKLNEILEEYYSEDAEISTPKSKKIKK